jgi:hypothetical protein
MTLAPAAAACSAVSSVEASSTTTISAPGHCSRAAHTILPIVRPSLKAGMTMLTLLGEGPRTACGSAAINHPLNVTTVR